MAYNTDVNLQDSSFIPDNSRHVVSVSFDDSGMAVVEVDTTVGWLGGKLYCPQEFVAQPVIWCAEYDGAYLMHDLNLPFSDTVYFVFPAATSITDELKQQCVAEAKTELERRAEERVEFHKKLRARSRCGELNE